jgi:hypothetical protein
MKPNTTKLHFFCGLLIKIARLKRKDVDIHQTKLYVCLSFYATLQAAFSLFNSIEHCKGAYEVYSTSCIIPT